MKTFTAVEERIYLVAIKYDHTHQQAKEVFDAFVKKHPEYEGSKYDFSLMFGQLSTLRIYFESAFDFVED